MIECDTCGYSTANFSTADSREHVELAYDNDTYTESLEREVIAYFDYRRSRMGKERYEYVFERLGLDPSVARLLDVGCGVGWFLAYLQDQGVACKGLEVNPTAVDFCRRRGLDAATTPLDDEPDGSFDVITMFDVLEHLDQPVDTLATARDKLKPGGFLVGYTPNIHSVAYELMGSKQNTLAPFEHVGFFNEQSFGYLAKHTGFEVYSVEVFGFDVMDYLLMKEHEDGVAYVAALRDMMLLVQACIDKLRVGNHFRITLRKPEAARSTH